MSIDHNIDPSPSPDTPHPGDNPAPGSGPWRPGRGPITRIVVWLILFAMAAIFIAMMVLVFFT